MTVLRRPGVALVTLLFFLLGAAFLTQVVPYRQIIDSQRQVASAQDRLAALEAENEELEADVAALNTDAEIEKLAREKLGYVRPGETGFVVLDPPGGDQIAPTETEGPVDEDKTWVDRLWEFVSGEDLGS
ncbi:MAG TPA: septum formation initiator family protein [Acidimicrobiia bacterium]|nr:septum formation initiator family protein [Acidimicrobiia bacterium]